LSRLRNNPFDEAPLEQDWQQEWLISYTVSGLYAQGGKL